MLDPISVISFDLIDEYFKDTCITERKWISYMKSNYNNISFLTNNIKIIKIKKGPKTNMSNYKITSDLSKKSIIENNNNIIFIIFNICRYSKNVCHANLLIIDKYKNEIYRFEPHGSESHYYVSKLIDSKIKKIMCPDFKYIGPANYQDISGPQDISENIENFEPIFSGFCLAWSLRFAHLIILYQDYDENIDVLNTYKILCSDKKGSLLSQIMAYTTFLMSLHNKKRQITGRKRSLENFDKLYRN